MVRKKPTSSENILILGLGGVGYYLAKRLTHEGHAYLASSPGEVARIGREAAREAPDAVRQIVTLGSPIVGGPRLSNVARS